MSDRFTCGLCGTLATQTWWGVHLTGRGNGVQLEDYRMCECTSCRRHSLWNQYTQVSPEGKKQMVGSQVWPVEGGPAPHDDMPQDARHHFEQARAVLGASPQAAAALLRVATESLVHHLLSDDKVKLNDGIARLVADGRINVEVKRACDVLRVTGNDMLHPGQIDPGDDQSEVASRLFGLVNLIVQRAITEPAEVETLYAALPETKRAQIDQRDGA